MYLDAIDHVQLAMPPGGEELATWFYAEVLGVHRVPKPPELAIRGGCWFERGALRIHLGTEDDFVPATKAHPAFAVFDLDGLAASLESAGIAVRRVEGPEGPQVYADDPFGNRLEFRPARPVAPPVDTSLVEGVAARAVGERLAAQLAFVAEIDRLKTVQRHSFIVGGERRENSAEHSWHVALLAIVLAEYATAEVDIARVVRMLLVHDIVEIDAGDTSVYDSSGAESKTERERRAADRIFGLLPADLGGPLRSDWEEFEFGTSADAVFARVFDRLSPFLMNLTAGDVSSWKRWRANAGSVGRVMSGVADGSVELGNLVEAVVEAAVAGGLMLPSSPLLD